MWLRVDCRDMELAVFHFFFPSFSILAPYPPPTQKPLTQAQFFPNTIKTRIPEMPVSEGSLSES